MAYGDRYYALDPQTGQWYTTDAQGNQLYNTPLPTGADGNPVDPATGVPLQWTATSFRPSQKTTSADPLTGTPARQDPVTSGQPAPQQATTPSDGKPPVVVQGPDVQVSATGNPTSTGTQTTTYPAPATGTGGVTVRVGPNNVIDLSGVGADTPYSRTRYVRWGGGDLSADSAKGYLYQLRQTAPDEYAAILNRMDRAGWDVSSPSQVQANWENVVGKAADSYDSGYKGLDPFVAIDLYSDLKGVKRGQGPEASVVSNIKLSSRSDARGALVASYQNLLGRDPSSKEVNAFTAALNSLEKSSPTTTTTIAAPSQNGISYDGQNIPTTETSSVQTGGFDSDQYSIDTAKSAGDYAEYQAETTFMNAILSAIQSPVNI